MERKIIILLTAGILFPFLCQAQLSKLMSKYHDTNCVTVTQLDKSLYALYKKDNLPAEADEMLQNLNEVNILNLNLMNCEPEMESKIAGQFRSTLEKTGGYKLIKSKNDAFGKQLIYTKSKNDKVNDLVVWNQTPERLDIIELRGDIQLDKVALLSRSLNIKGINSLASLSSNPESYTSMSRSNNFVVDENFFKNMERKIQGFEEGVMEGVPTIPDMRGMDIDSFIPQSIYDKITIFTEKMMRGGMNFTNRFFNDSTSVSIGEAYIFDDFWGGDFNPSDSSGVFTKSISQTFSNNGNITTSAVEISKENGKTKIKVDSKNTTPIFIIDGVENAVFPENMNNVVIVTDKHDPAKSYLLFTSDKKLGEFISFQNGILIFRYEGQEYKYNLEKSSEPLLIINGIRSSSLNLNPANILQIRPISPIEKEIESYSTAEVIINTK